MNEMNLNIGRRTEALNRIRRLPVKSGTGTGAQPAMVGSLL
ncbi:hypothetical protein [Biostraticola tofi]|nr:hypothetical protein [Biostraticola tofi]